MSAGWIFTKPPKGKPPGFSARWAKKGDYFICEAGDTIPADGEIVEGLASIDESATEIGNSWNIEHLRKFYP